MRNIYFLDDAEFDIRGAGAKAANLHELKHLGFAVPNGFILQHNLVRVSDTELKSAVQKIGGFPVAVRSSSNAEDLQGSSFAGQYLTILDVGDVSSLKAAILKCRDSLNSENAQRYASLRGFNFQDSKMTVLIQKMIEPICSGVCFTVHPLTGNEDHLLIESCSGVGEKLVSGQVNPSVHVVGLAKNEILEERMGDEQGKLPKSILFELKERALKIQSHFGCPQDIEWAYDEQGLHILQSRPITKIQWRTDIEEYTNADFRDGGVSARVCTPLMFSVYRDAMQISMQRYFAALGLLSSPKQEQWINFYYCRPYWNVSTVKRCLFKIPGFSEQSFDIDLGIQKDYGPKGAYTVPTNVKTVLAAIPVAIALEKEYVAQLKKTQDYGLEFKQKEKAWLHKIKNFAFTSDKTFFLDLSKFLEFQCEVESSYFTTIYNNSNAQSDFKKLIHNLEAKTKTKISVLNLISGLTNIGHLKTQSGLVKLYRVALNFGLDSDPWRNELSDFLSENYFHSDVELDLTVPRWIEKPDRIKEIIEEMIRSGATPRDPEVTEKLQHQEYEKERAKVELLISKSFILKFRFKKSFQKQIERSRLYLSRREAMREVSTRCYYLLRKYIIEAGKRFEKYKILSYANDIYMLQTEDIQMILEHLSEGSQRSDLNLESKIQLRTLKYNGFRNLQPPNELGRGVQQRSIPVLAQLDSSLQMLKGTGCSAGTVEGTVRVVKNLKETTELLRGEILVTKFTDPAWTSTLGLAAGVITEVGGLLSHAAVIGREFGIPAVLNLQGATTSLKTGQRVRVNGESGTVEVLV